MVVALVRISLLFFYFFLHKTYKFNFALVLRVLGLGSRLQVTGGQTNDPSKGGPGEQSPPAQCTLQLSIPVTLGFSFKGFGFRQQVTGGQTDDPSKGEGGGWGALLPSLVRCSLAQHTGQLSIYRLTQAGPGILRLALEYCITVCHISSYIIQHAAAQRQSVLGQTACAKCSYRCMCSSSLTVHSVCTGMYSVELQLTAIKTGLDCILLVSRFARKKQVKIRS